MIVNGQIKVKSGPKLQGFDETGALFDDGSKVEVDVVVVATGCADAHPTTAALGDVTLTLSLRYENVRETVKELCAPEIGEKIKPIWDFDEEYELNSVWRNCGVDKMWILFGMLELPYHPRHPLNFDFLIPLGNRKRGYIEVPFEARSTPNQSHEGRNL